MCFQLILGRFRPQTARKFIVSYYVRDFTMAVFEQPLRNSGIVGGKFLERSRVPHGAFTMQKYY